MIILIAFFAIALLFIIITMASEKEWGLMICALAFLALFIRLGWAVLHQPEEQQERQPSVIHCTSIERIDTLFKNGSIIGYEITIKEE